jgi:nicotinate-nucleotide pyrophosphorylase (carboxylating)
MTHAPLPELLIEPLVRAALMEDLGPSGDVTTQAVIPPGLQVVAAMNARDAGVVSGMQLAELAFRLVDPALRVTVLQADGSTVTPGTQVMEISGAASSILSAERVALNFAGRLSGIATLTAAFVARLLAQRRGLPAPAKQRRGCGWSKSKRFCMGAGPRTAYGLVRCDPDQG